MKKVEQRKNTGINVRPYQLLCMVCSLGEEHSSNQDKKLAAIVSGIKANPDLPVTIRCDAGPSFEFQNPGSVHDTAGGAEYNQKRDLDILHKLDLMPGAIVPARILFMRLFDRVRSVKGICGYDKVTSKAWEGCAKAKKGYYEKGHALGFRAIIPARCEQEMLDEKKKSIAALWTARHVSIRPHLLLCAVCQYGRKLRAPFPEDNLPEFLETLFGDNPEITVTLVRDADWMMCAPCPYRNPVMNLCHTGRNGAGELYCQIKDLNVLQALGLTYGASMKARDFYKHAFETIPTTAWICALDNEGLPSHSVWFNACDARKPQTDYMDGRRELMARFEKHIKGNRKRTLVKIQERGKK